MFFRNFILLLLSISLAANTDVDQSDDEILKESYNDCKKWANKTENELVSLNDFWLYMGMNDSDHSRILTYFKNKSNILQGIVNIIIGKRDEPEGLDLKLFRILFKEICKARCVAVKDWAVSRIKLAAKRTMEDTLRLQPAQTDDGAPTPIIELNEDETAILEESFNDCRTWLNVPLDSNIGISQFCCYMGLNENDSIIHNSYAKLRTSEYYVTNSDLAQGPIDVKLYSQLFKYLCIQTNADVETLAKHRQSKAAEKTPTDSEFSSLPPQERD